MSASECERKERRRACKKERRRSLESPNMRSIDEERNGRSRDPHRAQRTMGACSLSTHVRPKA